MPGSWEREIGGMMRGTETAGGSFKRRPWLRMGCCANDDDDDDDDYPFDVRVAYLGEALRYKSESSIPDEVIGIFH
jgi:hypothetical protein